MIIEGSLSVKAAIKGNKRIIEEIIIDKSKKDKDTNYIKKIASNLNIKITLTSRSTIDELCVGKSHGGVIAKVSNRNYQTLNSCFNNEAFVVIIEGIEDPFNLGYVFRSLYSAGCTGVIIDKRDWSKSESTILKSSAGAFDLINVHKSDDLKKVIDYAKKVGCITLAAMRKDAIAYDKVDYTQKVLVSIGGEMRGLSRVVLDNVDQNIFIPYANDFKNALNASSAVAVIAYEVFRQRRTL
ncbi:MAG: RNA methyltransferase [Erysipelotrichaceae bacterium]|nr:RNA methyltransferase [Erysipelotrichaceae bacterium]